MIAYILTKKTDEGFFKVNRLFASKEYAEDYKEKLNDSSLWKVEEVEYVDGENNKKNEHKIRAGQVYRQKEGYIPTYRKKIHDPRVFVITNVDMNIISGINTKGIYQRVLGVDWLEKDCELLAEYDTWMKAVNSKEFNEGRLRRILR